MAIIMTESMPYSNRSVSVFRSAGLTFSISEQTRIRSFSTFPGDAGSAVPGLLSWSACRVEKLLILTRTRPDRSVICMS